MNKKLIYFFFIFIIALPSLNANNDTSCISQIHKEKQGCSVANILGNGSENFNLEQQIDKKVIKQNVITKKTTPKKVVVAKNINISKELSFLKMNYKKEEILITRTPKDATQTCPPFCIQPMNIKGIKTVGELEVLEFIKDLSKKPKLFIDVRKSKAYNKETIPGAINIPFTMLDKESKYHSKVLKLLGAKKRGKKWNFKRVPSLLIFGEGQSNVEASTVIHNLLDFSFPNKKILYYRGGIESWKSLGLSLY